MEDFSKGSMVSFAEMMTSKGWINANTGGGHKAALNKILGDIDEDADVRRIDVKAEVRKYNNLNPGELSPASLKQYEKRVQAMIGYFVNWKQDPTNFKPPARELSEKGERVSKIKPIARNGKAPKRTASQSWTVLAPLDAKESAGTTAPALPAPDPVISLTMPFPLRDNYLAQITIPRDMSKDEAARLCTFIQALARA
jgi:hypothetical protein